MPDAQPKPTAAEVLARHVPEPWPSEDCRCWWDGEVYGNRTDDQRTAAFAQHQADMLAAAGLLVTAEHDAQVAERTLLDAAAAWQTGGWADDIPKGATRAAVILGMAQRATDWLRVRARADRIAAGGES